jgi:flagellar biosynthesis/type III secretory pathway M-ring protein FliF/YscJ
LVYVIVLVILFVVVFVITTPLRRGSEDDPESADQETAQAAPDVLELEAQRDAKYREIRDAELDHQTGKLSDEDFQAVDSNLRAEAMEILRRLDRARAGDR